MTSVGDRSEFAKGWPVLLAAALGNGGGLGALPIYSISTFIGPLSSEFGWGRAAIGAGATIVTAGMFLLGPLVGRLADRHGVRVMAIPSIILFAAAIAALGMIGPSIWSFYIGCAIMAVAGAATTSVTYSRAVNSWFVKNRGLALGIMMIGSGLTAFLVPLIVSSAIAQWGWRAGWLVCGLVALVPLPFAFFLLREKRRDAVVAGSALEPGMAFAEAVRSWRFWCLALAAVVFAAALGGFIVHVVPVLTDLGLSNVVAARYAALMGLGLICGRAVTGWLLDRFHGPAVAFLVMLSASLGFLLLSLGMLPIVPLAILLVGFSLGSEGDLLAYFTARYFGMRSYAEIFGWLFGILALGTAIGPLFIGVLYDPAKGYGTALIAFTAQCAIAGLMLGSLGRYPTWNADPETDAGVPLRA